MEYIRRELRKKGVTLQLLWEEYKQDNPDGYQRSHFCQLYRSWRKTLDVSWPEHSLNEQLSNYSGWKQKHSKLT